jgi:DNA-binding LacI/PurR family transcriptional regulator/DNA-binding transcriptional regulator YhcF (GntR family)
MSKTPLRAYDRALQAIETELNKARSEGHQRLPPLKEIAGQYGVSRDTLWRALAVFKKSGDLLPRPNRGILVSSDPRNVPHLSPLREQSTGGGWTSKPVQLRWQTVCDTIYGDLVRNAIDFRTAPVSLKELVSRYDSSYYIIGKAMNELVRRGVVQPVRRGFRRLNMPVPAGQTTIVLIAREFAAGLIPIPGTSLTSDLLLGVEQVCWQNKLQVHVTRAFYRKGDVLECPDRDNGELSTTDSIAGFIFWTRGFIEQEQEKMIQWALGFRKPVAVIADNSRIRTDIAPMYNNPYTRLFPVADTEEPGREVARFLIDRGHRSVAYVYGKDASSDPVAHNWRLNRASGVRSIFQEAGLADTLSMHALPVPCSPEEYTLLNNDFSNEVESAISNLLVRFNAPHWSLAYKRYHEVFLHLLGWESLSILLEEPLRRSLGSGPVTAIIAANDFLAVGCLNVIRKWGYEVPRDVSVIGFDDMPVSFEQRLTTYNFNAKALVNAMIDFILDPMVSRRKKSPVLEIPGYIVERSTVAPPGRHSKGIGGWDR